MLGMRMDQLLPRGTTQIESADCNAKHMSVSFRGVADMKTEMHVMIVHHLSPSPLLFPFLVFILLSCPSVWFPLFATSYRRLNRCALSAHLLSRINRESDCRKSIRKRPP